MGVEAYRVGGSVRDEILGREPKDADYLVRGVNLVELAKLCEAAGDKAKPLTDRQGQQFGVRTAKRGIEIALPRTEANDGEGRRQIITVDPTLPLTEDAKRRDFTFNALYKMVGPQEGSVVDPTSHGLYDLQRRYVRTTHPDSFRDDPLRTLRALRFVSTLRAGLAQTTLDEMKRHAEHVNGLTHNGHTSGTVYEEFSKLLMGEDPSRALEVARDTGVLRAALPELSRMIWHDPNSRYHDLHTCEHTFMAIKTAAKVGAPLRVMWALLFHDSGKPHVEWVGDDGKKHFYANGEGSEDHEVVSERLWREAAKRMNVPRRMVEDVALLIRHHMVSIRTKGLGVKVRRMRVQFGDDLLRDLFLHRTCDLSGKGVKVSLNHIQHIAKMERLRQEAQAANVPVSVKDLEIGGEDVKHLPGPARGVVLKAILDEVVCDPSTLKLSRDWQMTRIPPA